MQEQVQLGQRQDARSAQLFSTAYPGMQIAENYYQALSSGDPSKIFAAVSPGVQDISANTAAAKQNIRENMPRGGTETLALQEADISKSAQIGNLETKAFTSSFPALANLGTSGIGLSNNEIANAISAFSGASATAGNIAQTQEEGKGMMLGFAGDLASAGATVGAEWVGGGGGG